MQISGVFADFRKFYKKFSNEELLKNEFDIDCVNFFTLLANFSMMNFEVATDEMINNLKTDLKEISDNIRRNRYFENKNVDLIDQYFEEIMMLVNEKADYFESIKSMNYYKFSSIDDKNYIEIGNDIKFFKRNIDKYIEEIEEMAKSYDKDYYENFVTLLINIKKNNTLDKILKEMKENFVEKVNGELWDPKIGFIEFDTTGKDEFINIVEVMSTAVAFYTENINIKLERKSLALEFLIANGISGEEINEDNVGAFIPNSEAIKEDVLNEKLEEMKESFDSKKKYLDITKKEQLRTLDEHIAMRNADPKMNKFYTEQIKYNTENTINNEYNKQMENLESMYNYIVGTMGGEFSKYYCLDEFYDRIDV